MAEVTRKKIVLEDGAEYYGEGFGSSDTRVCEVVFNTSMVGYQEILSDPSYTDQAVVMTYPLIGNYGIADEDYETRVPTVPHDAVERVSCRKRWYSKTADAKYNVVAIDCGIKLNIIRSLNARGCNVTVMPYNTPAAEVEKMKPDGIFLSNGPGDPQDVKPVIELVRQLRGRYPIFGICLGHQIISLACGAKTYKLKFGHRGGNHPVKNLDTGKIEITSQNHSYAVQTESLEGTGLRVTHVNILDGTVEGVRDMRSPMFSVQYHPESAPGPQDSAYLFGQFIALMEE